MDKNNYYSNNNNNNYNYNKNNNGLSNSAAIYPQNRKTNNYNQPLDNRNKQISLSQNQQNQILKTAQNSQFKNSIASPFSSTGIITSQINVQNNNNENCENNISVVKKFKERTIAFVPGQTIEPQTKDEAFDNPVEIIIENPDGTKTSLIKQTKITTITENIPIEENKVQTLEGAPNLPLVKQLINYEYKTVTNLKEQIYNNNGNNTRGQDGKAVASQNQNYTNNNFGNEYCSCEEHGNFSYNNNEGNYDNNFTGDKKDNEKSWNNQDKINGDLNQDHDINLNKNKLDKAYNNNEVNMNINLDKQNIGNQKDGKFSNNYKYGDSQEGRNIISGKLDGRANEDQLNDNKNSDMLKMAKTKSKSIEQSINANDKSKSFKKGINSNMGIKEEIPAEGNLNRRMIGQKVNREEKEGNKLIKDENERKYKNLNSEENEDLENKNLSNKKDVEKLKYGKNLEINGKDKEDFYENIQDNQNLNIGNKRKNGKYNHGKISQNDQDKGLQDEEYIESKNNIKSKDENKINKNDLMSKKNNSNKNKKDKNKALGESENKKKMNEKSPSKGIKDENEKIIEEINKKGENATPEEKEKRLQYLEDLYDSISKEENNSNENLDKLSKILNDLNENEKKEILDKLHKKYQEKDNLYNELMQLVENKGIERQTKEEERKVGKKGGKESSIKESKNKNKNKKGEVKEEENNSLKSNKTEKKEGKKDELKDGKKKSEKNKKNDLIKSRKKESEKNCEKKLETKEKEKGKNKDDLLKCGKKESEEGSINDTFKNAKKKSGRNGKKSVQKIGMKESKTDLKDSLVKSQRRGEDLETKNELSRSIKLEDMASKYRLSKRHSANKERLSSHHKNKTINIFDVKNINPIKFEELFLDVTKYARERKEKNPFEGPSPYIEFYKERRIKIREKIIHMASGDIDDNIEIKLEENKIKEEESNKE